MDVQKPDEGQIFVAPGDVMKSLGVSGSTFRRISQDYEAVFGDLVRDANNRRLWTVAAAQRVTAAHEAVKEGHANSSRAALEAILAGHDLPTQPAIAPTSDTGWALDELRVQVQQQGKGMGELLRGLDARDAELAVALRAIAAAQSEHAQAIEALRIQVHASARPASAPARVVLRGLLGRLWWVMFGRGESR